MSTIRKKLDDNIPAEAVKTRQGGGGRSLSYLETWYVIDRLNQVLGQGEWAYSSEVNCVHNGTVTTYSGEAFSVHYIARVRLVCTIEGISTEFTDYGYGDGSDKNNPGKAHELAVKEAVSDGLKRCAKNLGRSMGLALYDKTQEYVDEAPKTDTKKEETRKEAKPKQVPQAKEVRSKRPLIEAAFGTLESTGKITVNEFKEKYLGGVGLSKITEPTIPEIWNRLQIDFPEIKER